MIIYYYGELLTMINKFQCMDIIKKKNGSLYNNYVIYLIL